MVLSNESNTSGLTAGSGSHWRRADSINDALDQIIEVVCEVVDGRKPFRMEQVILKKP